MFEDNNNEGLELDSGLEQDWEPGVEGQEPEAQEGGQECAVADVEGGEGKDTTAAENPAPVKQEELQGLIQMRGERDRLRQYEQETRPVMEMLTGFAQRSGMSLEQYLELCRTQALVQEGYTQEGAQARMEAERQQRQAQEQERQRQAQARQNEFGRFLTAFPDVQPDSIPTEVWQRVHEGEGLTAAYAMYRNRQLEAELAAERQNKANSSKAVGSMATAGEGVMDELFDGWDD